MLKESFDEDAYPSTCQSVILVHASRLMQKQLKDWFLNQRSKLGITGERGVESVQDLEAV